MLLYIFLPISLVILGIGLYLTYLSHWYDDNKYEKYSDPWRAAKHKFAGGVYRRDSNLPFVGIGIFCLVIVLIAGLVLGAEASSLRVIDDKIEMYQEENYRIEENVNAMVENYLAYEHDTFAEAGKDINPTLVFSMYPELKGNELVSKEIEIYTSNQEKLRELKASRFDNELSLWWLCFE